MSSIYTPKEAVAWRDADICDIVDPKPSGVQGDFDYEDISQTSQEMLPHPQANYVIPGYHPSTVPKVSASGLGQWSSPPEDIYYDENSNRNVAQHYPQHTGYDTVSGNLSALDNDSSSSVSSISGQQLANSRKHVPTSSISSDREKPVPKRQRGKVLNDQEAELMQKDDSLLTEDELVIKRKAQNRLAQRAFRERKESKLKALESKLLESEGERQRLLEALEEIKQQFISVKTENEVLRSHPGQNNEQRQNSKFTFPRSQEAFVDQMMSGQNHVINSETVSKIYEEPQRPGQKVLAVGAVWDYLSLKIEEEEYENIDMLDVMTCLKGNEVCHGYGPAYPLSVVEEALQRVSSQQK